MATGAMYYKRDDGIVVAVGGGGGGGGSIAYAEDVGATVAHVVAHGFGTRDVIVNVYRKTEPYDTVVCDVERTDEDTVTLRFATAPTAGQYRVVVIG